MRMAVYIHIVVFIVVNFTFINVKAGCSGNVRSCNWVPWKSWSDCSRTCGGGTRKRSRSYCCKPGLNIDDCMRDCGINSSFLNTYSHNKQSCNKICLNGIYINGNNSCSCNDEFYGRCCDIECPHIEHCKRRRCSSSLNTKCLECNYDQILFKKIQNDTKCEQIPQNLTLHLENPPSKDQDLTNNAVTLKCTTGCIFPTPSFIWYYLQYSDESGSKWSNSEPVTETPGQCKEFQKMFTSTLVLRKYTVFNDNADHTVRFQCGATIMNDTSDEIKTQSSVNIRFAVRVVKVSLKIRNSSGVSSLNVTNGISEVFKCTTSDSRPLPTIVWYIGRTEKERVVGTESTHAFIPNISESGKEVYCKAFNIQPENEALSSNKVSLYVREIPQNLTLHLENPPSKDQDVANNAVTLKCTTGCIFPTPSFIWYYLQSSDGSGSKWSNSEPVTETPGQCEEFQKMFTSTLVLRKYTVFHDNADHTVRFQCGATIMNDTSGEVKSQSSVNIRFAVRVVKVSLKTGNSSRVSSLNVTDGISEIFKCTTSESRPLPTIVWYIGRTEKKKVVGTESTLAFIPSITDSGKEVYCKAFNIQPENEALSSNKVFLYVRERASVNSLYFEEHAGETNVTIDENYVNLQLTCNISGNPASSVEIKFEEKSLIEKANINELRFVRQRVACFHSGEYTCVGKDELGNVTNKTLYLFVNCPPRPSWQAITNTTCSFGEPVTLTFTAIAYPTPSSDGFKWYKQISNEWIPLQSNKGVQIYVKGLETNLNIVNVTQANLGQYRLTVENSVGIYNQYYFLIEKDDPSVDVGIETMVSSNFETATIVLAIIYVICAGTSAGIVIWIKRKAKGTAL